MKWAFNRDSANSYELHFNSSAHASKMTLINFPPSPLSAGKLVAATFCVGKNDLAFKWLTWPCESPDFRQWRNDTEAARKKRSCIFRSAPRLPSCHCCSLQAYCRPDYCLPVTASFPFTVCARSHLTGRREGRRRGSDKGMKLEVEVPLCGITPSIGEARRVEIILQRANVNTKKCEIPLFSAVDRASWFMHTIIQALHVFVHCCVYVLYMRVWVSEA